MNEPQDFPNLLKTIHDLPASSGRTNQARDENTRILFLMAGAAVTPWPFDQYSLFLDLHEDFLPSLALLLPTWQCKRPFMRAEITRYDRLNRAPYRYIRIIEQWWRHNNSGSGSSSGGGSAGSDAVSSSGNGRVAAAAQFNNSAGRCALRAG